MMPRLRAPSAAAAVAGLKSEVHANNTSSAINMIEDHLVLYFHFPLSFKLASPSLSLCLSLYLFISIYLFKHQSITYSEGDTIGLSIERVE